MTPEEFERLKNEEKAHLRQLRALKQQHRDAQRKASILGALGGMRNAELEAETQDLTDRLMRDAAVSEARMDVALEGGDIGGDALARAAQAEADREAMRRADAEALVRQMKAGMGEATPPPATSPSVGPATGSVPGSAGPPADRTIGRTPPPPAAPPSGTDAGAKTIGRRPQ